MTWKLSRVDVDMRVYFDIGCKTSTAVLTPFQSAAAPVLFTVNFSIIIPACVPGYTVKVNGRKGVGRWLINRRVQIEGSSRR